MHRPFSMSIRRLGAIALLLCASQLATIGLGRADEPQSLTEHTLSLGENEPGQGSLEAMSWLEGHWVGSGLGGEVEEVWSSPRDGQMMGMFRFLRDGKVAFYELLTLSERDGGIELRVKHFGPDLVGWEEKDDSVQFRWIGQAEGRRDFHGLSFRPSADGQELTIYLALKQSDGSYQEGSFELRRK
ncbi:MAG: hypothetical protein KDA83_16195 [Planctomycetales bacterium]|nr:hypothetical protein [Planctomycetales bacterium]